MPVGRDAAACAQLLQQAGLEPQICDSVEDLLRRLDQGTEVVLLTEEALYGKRGDMVADWVARQEPWSDQPFIVLTNHNDGPHFVAFRRGLVDKLCNIAFLERPLQAISVQAAVLTAERGRRRQYQARAYLEIQRDAAAELERLVAARTEALEQANDNLRDQAAQREQAQIALMQAQKIETLGQLVGGVAHDFNNLLMAVICNLELLAKRVGNDSRQARLISGAMEGATRGATLTQRLLAFARKQELQTRPTDILALVEGMRDLVARSVGPLVSVRVVAKTALPAVSIDPNQLEMALLNLAVNARDAMPNGGRLTISLAQHLLPAEEGGLKEGRYVCLTVADTGQGMDEETLGRAIEPFFSTKGVGKGTGLGLSMVHGLADQSGGVFRLESTFGVGTNAHLWLPAAREAAMEEPVSEPLPDAAAPATILLVDDDLLVAASTQALLEDLGHHVIEAHSGREALDLVEKGLAPDLVITDHAMPGMTGTDLAVVLRARDPALPILLATGHAELKGAQPLELPRLTKPYNQASLSLEIARLLS
ncbi:MAG TPA: response regulator [Magnetospirillaceae bacterium]|nr:response regulator [Magnetospirillaceae bacterium]